MEIRDVPVAKAEMLIRKPVAQVFEAFVDPAITSKFWFTKGSGRLEAGKRIRWDWEMYDVFAQVSAYCFSDQGASTIIPSFLLFDLTI